MNRSTSPVFHKTIPSGKLRRMSFERVWKRWWIRLRLPVNTSKGSRSRYVHRPVADKLNRPTPHVRSMLTAMRERDRAMALAHGETILQRV